MLNHLGFTELLKLTGTGIDPGVYAAIEALGGNAIVTGVVALGSDSQANAAAIDPTKSVQVIATATGDSLRLPTAVPGMEYEIHNITGSTLNIFPAVGGKINNGSTDAKVTLATAKARTFRAVSATEWYSLLGA